MMGTLYEYLYTFLEISRLALLRIRIALENLQRKLKRTKLNP